MQRFMGCYIVWRFFLTVLLCAGGCPRMAPALEPVTDPNLAVVRIKSHGGSGTVIATTDGKSWILSCAHMFFGRNDHIDPKLIGKKLVIDGPVQPYAPRTLAHTQVLAIDADLDLSLIEIANGPYNYVQVAKVGHQPGRYLMSAGYDDMKWPITSKPATIVHREQWWTYTRERPWHGRSGGGLFDVSGQVVLIGVVNGYETKGPERGIYVSHESVLRFLQTYQNGIPITPASPPEPMQRFRYSNPTPYSAPYLQPAPFMQVPRSVPKC